jgi:serine/threonine protein kinase
MASPAAATADADRAQNTGRSSRSLGSGATTPPELCGSYTLVQLIARGGMAEVWRATQEGIGGFQRTLVIKRILPHLARQPDFVRMFLSEARLTASLSHPNIAQVLELGADHGRHFLAMEYVDGRDLRHLMRRATQKGCWPSPPLAFRIIADACAALHHAHTRRDARGRPLALVHRDVSPHNILLTFDGCVKLIDFGIARSADQLAASSSGVLKGKAAYMAPEQVEGGPIDARTDVFALGLVLYELLTGGVQAFRGDSQLATLHAAATCAPQRPSSIADLPPVVDELVMRALAKDPADRYPDARSCQLALEAALKQAAGVACSVQLAALMSSLFDEAPPASRHSSAARRSPRALQQRPGSRSNLAELTQPMAGPDWHRWWRSVLGWGIAGAIAVALMAGGATLTAAAPATAPGANIDPAGVDARLREAQTGAAERIPGSLARGMRPLDPAEIRSPR